MVTRNIMVIKIGGSLMDLLHPSFFSTCVSLLERGWQPVIVHGGVPGSTAGWRKPELRPALLMACALRTLTHWKWSRWYWPV